MMSSQAQNALSELMRMVGHMPSQTNNVSLPQQPSNRKTSQQTQNLRLPVQQSHLQLQQQNSGFKPLKPLEKRTAAIKPQKNGVSLNGNALPNNQTIDPRFLFPAAFQMNNSPMLKMPSPGQPSNFPMSQMLSLPTGCVSNPFQLTPEMLAMSMSGWPMDSAAIMQQPALLNKLYSDYMTYVQQQQQQYFQTLMLQSAQNGNNYVKLNESPKGTPPSSNSSTTMSAIPTTTNSLDPLASLHNMVHSQPKTNDTTKAESLSKAAITKKQEPKIKKKEMDEDEEIIIDVGTTATSMPAIQNQEKAIRNTPPQSAPPKIAGSSFSIAEILHSNNSQSQVNPEINYHRTLTPMAVSLCLSQNGTDVASSSATSRGSVPEFESPTDSQLNVAELQRQSPLQKKSLFVGDKQRMAQRKKHVEFHRRIKGIASRGKFSQCQLCGEIVDNNCSELKNHVYSHSKRPLFGCLRCRSSFRLQADLHNHNKVAHPNDLLSENDLRDMSKLCDLLEKCFPRNTRLTIDTLLNKLIKTCKSSETLRCKLCDKVVPTNVNSMKNHLTQHPRYRCKLCHFTNEDECEQVRHGQEQHQSESAIYNVTSAAIALSSTLTACFGEYLPADQQEFCEEMASMVAQDSPQGSPQHAITSGK